tara:strand:- start:2777 stop:3868 length:1092 start_codon:yes stop_codon:yes gene_type:complete
MKTVAFPMVSDENDFLFHSETIADFDNYFHNETLNRTHATDSRSHQEASLDAIDAIDLRSSAHIAVLPDLALGDFTQEDLEIDLVARYPTELDFQHFDIRVESQNSDETSFETFLPDSQGLEVFQQDIFDDCALHKDDIVRTTLASIDADLKEPSIVLTPGSFADPSVNNLGAHLENGDNLSSAPPTWEQAVHAMGLVERFLWSKAAKNLLDPHDQSTIARLTSKLRGRGKRKRGYTEVVEDDDAPEKGRLSITNAAKQLLEEHFLTEPYPRIDAVSRLSAATGMSAKQIKTWFANSRSRKKGSKCKWRLLPWHLPDSAFCSVAFLRKARMSTDQAIQRPLSRDYTATSINFGTSFPCGYRSN